MNPPKTVNFRYRLGAIAIGAEHGGKPDIEEHCRDKQNHLQMHGAHRIAPQQLLGIPE